MSTRVRFAPSPTGKMHVGNFRSALYNYLFARKHGGVFYLRIEDTDRTRLVERGVESIIESLRSMGLDYDEGPFLESGQLVQRGDFGPYVQSERLGIYRTHIDRLLDDKVVYPCFCTAERLDEVRKSQEATKQPTGYDRHCRHLDPEDAKKRAAAEPHVIRFKMPSEGETEFHDAVRGPVSFKNALLDDYVLLKSDGFPTYHLASVVDDHLMQTSHVIRGEEWLSSTPKHILLYKAFGWDAPQFAHLPLLLNPDRSKLSKRQGDVSVEDYLAKGYLPEALMNFVALMGWNPSAEQEIYTAKELIAAFDLSGINPAGAVFNREKLDWLNGKYLRALTPSEYAERAAPFLEDAKLIETSGDRWLIKKSGEKLDADELGKLISLEQERVKTLSELPEAVAYLFADELDYPAERLAWKGMALADVSVRLDALLEFLGGLDETEFDRKTLEDKTRAMVAERGWGNGDTLWPLRVALSGQEKSPSPFEIMEVLGKMKVLKRLEAAKKRLK
jgi:glutamyl-tRNA synthetase